MISAMYRRCGFRYEKKLRAVGVARIAGIDEAGRGALAGPVVAAAVVLPEKFRHRRLNDSKQLAPDLREEIYSELVSNPEVRSTVGIIDLIEKEQQKDDANSFKVGDSIRVHTRVVEGDKERIQIFAGIVIGRKGQGLNETFTVRRISYGEGVERVFPLNSPRIAKIEIETEGKARRAKLNYLRRRKGKEATTVRE